MPHALPYAVLTVGLIVFVFAFDRLNILAKVGDFAARTRRVARVLRAPRVSEIRKERAVQRAALRLTAASLDILARSAAAVAAAAAGGGVAVALGPVAADDVAEAGADPFFVLFLTALAVLQAKFFRRRAKAAR